MKYIILCMLLVSCGGPKGHRGDKGPDTVVVVTDNTSGNGPATPGPQGPQGDRGPTGETGSSGNNGDAGQDGMNSYNSRCHYRRYPYDWSIFYAAKRLQDRTVYVALCSGWNIRSVSCENGLLAERIFGPDDPEVNELPVSNGVVDARLTNEVMAEFTTNRWIVSARCL